MNGRAAIFISVALAVPVLQKLGIAAPNKHGGGTASIIRQTEYVHQSAL